jgi:hypothetical protein
MSKRYRVTRKKSLRLTRSKKQSDKQSGKRSDKRSDKRSGKRSGKRKTIRKTIRKRRLTGGNYERDVTTRTYEGFPMKPLNKVVTSVPGRGVMSVSAYAKLMEDLDRNGNDFYD